MTTIAAVSYYEIKTSLRSLMTLLLIFVLIPVLIYNYWVITLNWEARGVSSFIPYKIVLMLNIVFTYFSVLFTITSHSNIVNSDSIDALFVRSFKNIAFIVGAFIGQLGYFLFFTIAVLTATFLFNMLALDDTGVNIIAYPAYFFLFSVPSIVFVMGLSFFVVFLLRNKGLSILLLALLFTVMIKNADFHHGLFDYLGLYTPSVHSDFIGFGNVRDILLQRVTIAFAGVACLGCSVFLLPRIPESRKEVRCVAACLLVSVLCITMGHSRYSSHFSHAVSLRDTMRSLNDRYFTKPVITVTACDLSLDHRGDTIDVSAKLSLNNTTGTMVDSCFFSLNPALNVLSVSDEHGTVSFNRLCHIISIAKPLLPDEEASLSIRYSGSIDESACYTDIKEKELARINYIQSCTVDKRFAFITPRYVLLTSEALWYPTSGVPCGSVMPKEYHSDLVRYSLAVTADPSLTVISQGREERRHDGARIFTCEYPLPKISLIIGDYEKKSLVVDNVEYMLYLKKGHDFLTPYFSEIDRYIPKLISRAKQGLEFKVGLTYPFKRFSIIETPVQFLAYQRYWSISPATIQPEQVLMPEKGIFMRRFDIKKQHMYAENYPYPLIKTPESIKQYVFSQIAAHFVEPSYNRLEVKYYREKSKGYSFFGNTPFDYVYTVLPEYSTFAIKFDTRDNPLLSHVLDRFLLRKLDPNDGDVQRRNIWTITTKTDYEAASPAFENASLYELCIDQSKSDIITEAFHIKSIYLMQHLHAIINDAPFDEFLVSFFLKNRFKTVTDDVFYSSFKKRFDVDPEPIVSRWAYDRGVPGFAIANVRQERYNSIRGSMFNYTFTITNVGTALGVFEASYIYRLQEDDPESIQIIKQYFTLNPGETKKIGKILKVDSQLCVKTFVSRNVPNYRYLTPQRRNVASDAQFFEGEQLLTNYHANNNPDEIIVDNTDSGFEVENGGKEGFLVKLFRHTNIAYCDAPVPMNSFYRPKKWHQVTEEGFYGRLVQSAYIVRSGTGKKKARWNADIPRDGIYEVYTYRAMNYTKPEKYHYRVFHDDGMSDVQPEVKNMERWVSLGKYHFSKGKTAVELSDKTVVLTNDNYVLADAVKWVRVSGE